MTQLSLPFAGDDSGGNAQAQLPPPQKRWIARNFGWTLILATLVVIATISLTLVLVFGSASSPTPASKNQPKAAYEKRYYYDQISRATLSGPTDVLPISYHNRGIYLRIVRGCVERKEVKKSVLGFAKQDVEWKLMCAGQNHSLPDAHEQTFRGTNKAAEIVWIICWEGYRAIAPHGCVHTNKLPDGRPLYKIQRTRPWPMR